MIAIETSRTLTTGLSGEAYGADIAPDGKRRWNYHGDCSQPQEMRLAGRPDKLLVALGIEKDEAFIGYAHVRCRKCDNCLEHRRRLWTARAIAELQCSDRTWFGTLTAGPEYRVRAKYQAMLAVGDGWSQLSDMERFKEVANVMNKDVTLYLKRLRKNAKASFRYLLVIEAHKDGFPHFHMLLHEVGTPVRKRVLDEAWKLGFSKWKLCDRDPKTSGYVCKYLAKSALTRIRASQKYGQACYAYAAERLLDASRTVAHFAQSIPYTREGKPPSVGGEGSPKKGFKGPRSLE